MARSEILRGPERRRRWTIGEKAAVLSELDRPGVRSADVARHLGVSRSLLYAWRKELGGGRKPTTEMPFAPVLIAAPVNESTRPPPMLPAVQGMIEIDANGTRVRLPVETKMAVVVAAIRAVRGEA